MESGGGLLRIRKARAGNLQELDLDLQQGAWTAVHGASGAGKSALLFGLLAPVSRRRFRLLDDPAALPGGGEAWLKPLADRVQGLHPVIAGAGEIPRGRRHSLLVDALDLWPLLEQAWLAAGSYRCTACDTTWVPPRAEELAALAQEWDEGLAVHVLAEAAGQERDRLLQGGWTRYRLAGRLQRLEEAEETLPAGSALLIDRFKWRAGQEARWREAVDALLARGVAGSLLLGEEEQAVPAAGRCPSCGTAHESHGWQDWARRADLRDRDIDGRPWASWLEDAVGAWRELPGPEEGSARRRLEMLARTGLGHLAATRTLGTLSLGEARRLELSSWIAQVRSGQTVLLDEPGMGLHGRERQALAVLLQELVAQGNTVLTADPSREFLEAAHHWLWLGPGGGPAGGRIVGQGPRAELPVEEWQDEELVQERPLADLPTTHLRFRDLRHRFVDVPELAVPLGRLVAFCGVSGSGKTTLVEQQLLPALRQREEAPAVEGELPLGGVAALLERALRWSPWSTVATLSGVWAEVRQAFAEGEEGRIRGLSAADLVARPERGGCASCDGHGLDRDGLPCPACDGLGLREDLLALRLRQRSLREWLTTPLARLEKRLPARGKLRTTVRHLIDLGLGERHLGERGRFLSLGERGRLALARALASARRDRPKLFLLDEPCLGLPVQEARRVVQLLRRLCAEGHSVWVVEHHEYLLRAADHLIELGPGAGREGGKVVFAGTPEEVLGADTATGQWLHARRRAPLEPPPPRELEELPSAIIPEAADRRGRRRLEEELRRELAMRSPLLQDQAAGGLEPPEVDTEDEALWTPVAWPGAPPATTGLLEVLGLAAPFADLVARHARHRCAHCGGGGPWPDLETAVRDLPGIGPWRFTSPLPAELLAREEHPAWLRAAGFRRFQRGGESFRWTRDQEQPLEAGDEVFLEEMDRDDPDLVGRLRDLQHQAELLGDGRILVGPPEAPEELVLDYHADACRECHRRDVGLVAHLGGVAVSELQAGRLDELLRVTTTVEDAPPAFAEARRLLAASSLPACTADRSWRGLQEEERRIARLTGLLLFPLEGVALLLDQPLSGLPAGVARTLGHAMLEGEGRFRFTEPDGWLLPEEELRAGVAGAEPDDLPHPGELEDAPAAFSWSDWCRPPRAETGSRLREALGLEHELRQYFLRTEGARLAGWTEADLDPRRSAHRCPACRGSGETVLHPALRLACPRCQGRGWQRSLAAAEDRGLRWPDLGQETVEALAAFFAGHPRLGETLAAAAELGLGGYRLDERLDRLPRGVRMLAPLAGVAPEAGREELQLGLALPGWNPLEASRISRRIRELRTRAATFRWRDRHPLPALP